MKTENYEKWHLLHPETSISSFLEKTIYQNLCLSVLSEIKLYHGSLQALSGLLNTIWLQVGHSLWKKKQRGWVRIYKSKFNKIWLSVLQCVLRKLFKDFCWCYFSQSSSFRKLEALSFHPKRFSRSISPQLSRQFFISDASGNGKVYNRIWHQTRQPHSPKKCDYIFNLKSTQLGRRRNLALINISCQWVNTGISKNNTKKWVKFYYFHEVTQEIIMKKLLYTISMK